MVLESAQKPQLVRSCYSDDEGRGEVSFLPKSVEHYFFIKKGGKTLKNKGFFLNVPKSVHTHAVVRNRIKRRLRPLVLKYMSAEHGQITVSVRKDIDRLSATDLEHMVKSALERFH